jgi:hypothetical protein
MYREGEGLILRLNLVVGGSSTEPSPLQIEGGSGPLALTLQPRLGGTDG